MNVRVGGNDYSVDVLTAVKNDGREVAYDVVNIQPTTIKASDEKTSEAFGGSRRTIADLAEGGNRGLPGSPLSAEAKTTTQESAGSSSAQNPDTNIAPGGQEVKGKAAESYADMARAAYVLNNFDNAYLSTRKADGYFNSRGKRAPIVIFEKKIEGSHIVVEAVCDTKKNTNYIVTEYLSRNGVDAKEIAKALRPSMDAITDPRDTSETLNAATSAMESTPQPPMSAVADPEVYVRNVTVDYDTATSVAPGGQEVKGKTAESYADVTLKANAGELDSESWNRTEQLDAARQLVRDARMSTKGVQTVVNNMPQGVGAEIYAPAAASLYRLGVVEDVATFEDALRLTGKGGMSARVQQVLALGKTGETALKIAYLQGKGEAEQYRANKAAELGERPGAEALHEEAGSYTKNGKVSEGKSARDALIELTAKGTAVAAEQKVELQKGAKGELQAAIGKVFYSAEADTATVLHETLHEVNRWSNETGQELIDTFHHYLVMQNGMESVQELVQGYMERYEKAGQTLSYNQAMEEVTADAMQTIFGTEESFRNFLRLQASEARMNADAQKRTRRVMEKIETLLKRVLSDIKNLLVRQPTNAAARAAQSLTEQQLRDLQDIYFAHQIEAGANYRAALEEGGMKKAASVETQAVESRFQLQEGEGTLEEQLNDNIDQLKKMSSVAKITGREVPYGKTPKENAANIFAYFESIGGKVERKGFGTVELGRKGAKATVQHGNSPVKQNAVAAVPDVIRSGKQIGYVENWKGRGCSTYVFAAPVTINGTKIYEAVIVNAYESTKQGNKFYVHEVCGTDGSLLILTDDGQIKQKQESADTVLKTEEGAERPGFPAEISISYEQEENKTRYQLDVDEEDVAAAREKSVGDGGTETQIIQTAMETAQASDVSHESLAGLAKRLIKRTASRADTQTITNRLSAINSYLKGGEVDYAVAHSIMLDVAQQVMEKSAKRNDELWKQYPELHKMSMQIEKGSSDYE